MAVVAILLILSAAVCLMAGAMVLAEVRALVGRPPVVDLTDRAVRLDEPVEVPAERD
jgi:hypothetical protein